MKDNTTGQQLSPRFSGDKKSYGSHVGINRGGDNRVFNLQHSAAGEQWLAAANREHKKLVREQKKAHDSRRSNR